MAVYFYGCCVRGVVLAMNDRILLAEFCGYVPTYDNKAGLREEWYAPDGRIVTLDQLPDPETDANDDYAVLEKMREQKRDMFANFYWSLQKAAKNRDYANPGARRFAMAATQYQIGDYARAALKIIKAEKEK